MMEYRIYAGTYAGADENNFNCLASVSEKGYTTVNDSPEAIALSWEFSTTPAEIAKIIDGKKLKPTAILTLDSTKIDAKKLAALEEILYGKDPTTPEGNDGVDRSALWPILLLIRIFTQCGMSSSWERSGRFPALKYSIRV